MTEFRSGFVCFVGRPNTGKSTLTNALVGSKVAITSSRPQTTRHTIRGIVHREDFQIVLVDTPGLHRPRTLLGKRLNDLVRDTYAEVVVVTKIDRVTKDKLAAQLAAVGELVGIADGRRAEIVPVSAVTGEQMDVL